MGTHDFQKRNKAVTLWGHINIRDVDIEFQPPLKLTVPNLYCHFMIFLLAIDDKYVSDLKEHYFGK